MSRVFLGGTCNGSRWRESLIPMLEEAGVEYFNPVVVDWTPDCRVIEEQEKKACDYHLYCITPLMTGVYSIAELVDSAHRNPGGTIFSFGSVDGAEFFTSAQIRSLEAVGALVVSIGGMWAFDLDTIVRILKEGVRSVPGRATVQDGVASVVANVQP